MANPATTFEEFFGAVANPYVPREVQYYGFTPQPALQPQGILQSLELASYPSVLITATTNNTPILYLAGSFCGGHATWSSAACQQDSIHGRLFPSGESTCLGYCDP
jgi:hypothetical protein